MQQVWKFIIHGDGTIEMPCGAKLLSVAFQGDNLCLWVLVDASEHLTSERRLIVRGTGHNIPNENALFIGTAFTGPLVFHVFELI